MLNPLDTHARSFLTVAAVLMGAGGMNTLALAQSAGTVTAVPSAATSAGEQTLEQATQ